MPLLPTYYDHEHAWILFAAAEITPQTRIGNGVPDKAACRAVGKAIAAEWKAQRIARWGRTDGAGIDIRDYASVDGIRAFQAANYGPNRITAWGTVVTQVMDAVDGVFADIEADRG